jgi:hypothetical protein
LERIILLGLRTIEKQKLKVTTQWISKKGAKDDEGKPFVFVITGVGFKNENPFWSFPRDTADISETRISVFDKDGKFSIPGSRFGRWWNYELADSDPLFPKSYVIPQEENAWVHIPPAVEKRLIIGYWIKETNSFYIYTTSSHRKNRWAKREDRVRGRFPFYTRVDIIGKNFVDAKRFVITNNNDHLEINECKTFPFQDPAT